MEQLLLSFAGWETALHPKQFNLLSILKFRRTKDDFTYDKSAEHTEISKFVLHVASTEKNEEWKNAACLLGKNGMLKVSNIACSQFDTKEFRWQKW